MQGIDQKSRCHIEISGLFLASADTIKATAATTGESRNTWYHEIGSQKYRQTVDKMLFLRERV